MRENLRLKDNGKIFDFYISKGIFSDYINLHNFYGDYRYMGTIGKKDLFKHRDTGDYLRIDESFESSLISEPLRVNVRSLRGHHAQSN